MQQPIGIMEIWLHIADCIDSHPSINPAIHPSIIHQAIHLSIHQSIHVSTHTSTHVSISQQQMLHSESQHCISSLPSWVNFINSTNWLINEKKKTLCLLIGDSDGHFLWPPTMTAYHPSLHDRRGIQRGIPKGTPFKNQFFMSSNYWVV